MVIGLRGFGRVEGRCGRVRRHLPRALLAERSPLIFEWKTRMEYVREVNEHVGTLFETADNV